MNRHVHAIAVGIAALSLTGRASAQTREAHGMLPPSPFDTQAPPQKLAPPPPPPWDEPLSTSGTELVSRAPEQTAVAAPDSSGRFRELERRIAELEREKHEGTKLPDWVEWLHPSLLLQPQLIWNFYNAAASPNSQNGLLPPGVSSNDVTATPNGTTNPDFLRLRRARLKLDFIPSEYARFVVEIEPVPRDPTVPGSGTIARQIEAIAHFPVSKHIAFELGGGSFEVPFGGEWREEHGDRPFIERSYFEQNVFPGEFDLGFHASLLVGRHFELEVATINGRTFGELDNGGNLDLNRAKDVASTFRFTFPGIELGASGYAGVGQLVDSQNLIFKQYTRLALDADVGVHQRTPFGSTRAFIEGFLGSNMDRGVLFAGNLPAIPIDITQNVTDRVEVGVLARIDQDLGRYFTIGARYDYYTPDVNLLNNGRHTVGGVLALRLIPELQGVLDRAQGGAPRRFYIDPRLQVMLEYAHAIDTIRASGPVPDVKEIDTLSFVLQGRL